MNSAIRLCFFNDTATTEIYTLSLHDALPICAMRFKVDENLPEELADFFRGRGWDCMTVDEQQLGGALDDRITEICDDEDRILVTLDLGFSNIRDYPPAAHPGY